MTAAQAEASFLQEVIDATPGGERLRQCLQCGTCGGSCPNGADMDRRPRGLFQLIAANKREEALRSNAMWYCVSCYLCTVRCPKNIPITEVMYTLRRMAAREQASAHKEGIALARSFMHYVEKYGRSFEFGLASRYTLLNRPTKIFGLGWMGLAMLRHGRMHIRPSKIAHLDELQAILAKARQVGGEA